MPDQIEINVTAPAPTKAQIGLGNVPDLDTTQSVANSHTHANKSILDAITEAFTTALKSAYDSAASWISTNGATVVAHLSRTDNPHSVTKAQVGLGNADNTSDVNKPVSSATQTALNAKYDASNPSGYETTSQLNARDTNNRSRANHTGTQTVATISDFSTAAVSAVQSLLDAKIFTLSVMSPLFTPVNAQTIYIGNYPALGGSTAAGSRRIYIPKTGVLVGVAINILTNGTVGTGESWAMSIRKGDGTLATVASVATINAHRTFLNTSMSLSVTAGDYVEVQLVNPTWATPPTNISVCGNILIR